MRIRRSGHFARTLHARVKYQSDASWSADIELPATQDTPTVLQHFERLWVQRPPHPSDAPRSVSVDLGGLQTAASTTGNLFEQADRPQALSDVMDAINRKFGSHAVHPGSMTEVVDYAMDDKIAFGRIPEEDIPM